MKLSYIIVFDDHVNSQHIEFSTARIEYVKVGACTGGVCEVLGNFGYLGFRRVEELYATREIAINEIKHILKNRQAYWEKIVNEATLRVDRYTNILSQYY